MVLVSVAALLAGAALAVWLVALDEAPPNISDLPEVRPVIPDSDNAFPGLLAVAQTLADRAKTDRQLAAALESSATARKRDPEELAHLRLATADLVAPWREAVARPRSVAPAYRESNKPPYEFGHLHKLGRLAAVWTVSDGPDSPPDAVRRLGEALRAGHHITESYDTLIVYLTGIATTNLALAEIVEFVDASPPAPNVARQLIALLDSARLSPEPLASILQNEAHFTVQNANDDEIEKFIDGMIAVGIPRPPPGAIFFHKPNQSARWVVDELRSGLAQIDAVPISNLVVRSPDHGSATLLFGLPHPDNAFGRHYSAHRFFDFTFVLRLRPLLNARLSALQTWIALKAEKSIRNGDLPATLDELVPAYFPRVPVDTADGSPIRYSRDRGIVWSVGANNHEPTDEPAPLPAIEYRLD